MSHVFEHLDLFEGFLELKPVFRFYVFTDKPQSVSVRNRTVVVIFMNVISENMFGVVAHLRPGLACFILGAGDLGVEQRSAGQPDLDSLFVGLVQVGQEASLRIIAAVNFVQEVDAL